MRISASRSVIWSCLALSGVLLLGCPKRPLENNPDATMASQSRPIWSNWSQNLVHKPSVSGAFYYFAPTTEDELRQVVLTAAASGVELRASGQRHSQPPLVADDNRATQPYNPKTWLVDLSCYKDLGQNGDQQISLDAANHQVTVNAGVREGFLDAYLTENDLILKTVTAGGFFSLGGMTAVDVHGATIEEPIFAETVSKFTVMGPDGVVTTIDTSTPDGAGGKAIDFARVSLGSLGIVTSVTVDVAPRKWANTLRSGSERFFAANENAFVEKFTSLLTHDRVESFYSPYINEFFVLWWDLEDPDPSDQVDNPEMPDTFPDSCTYGEAIEDGDVHAGAPYQDEMVEWLAQGSESWVQFHGTRDQAIATTEIAFLQVESLFDKANDAHSDLWLTEAARVAFMSYFVELPEVNEAGLRRAWQALNVVTTRLNSSPAFRMAAPLEFRFVKGGSSALSGTYTTNSNATFVNLDLIAFVPADSSSNYPTQILDFFADIEREWYGTFNGRPHNGKMYGFYDPGSAPGSSTAPFSQAFLSDLATRRGAALQAFEAYRLQRDPNGLFCNDFLRAASICTNTTPP